MAAVFGSFKVVVTDTSGAVLSLCDKFLGSDEQVQYFRGVKICRSINATPDSRFRINLSIGKGFVFEGCDVLFIGVFMDGIFPQCFIVDKAVFAAQNDVWTASCENRFSSGTCASWTDDVSLIAYSWSKRVGHTTTTFQGRIGKM